MKKRILALLCSAVMLLCLFPQAAFAAGTLEGVDYTRIGGSGSRVTLTLGELEFEGQLSRGSLLSQREQDSIITKTMNDLNLTSGMLINAKSLLDAANNIEGFNLSDVTDALFKLTGVESLIDLYNVVMKTNEKSAAEIATTIAQDRGIDAAEDALEGILTNGGKVAMKGAGKFAFKLLFILPDLTEIGVASLTKYENIKGTVAAAVERQALLDTFYDTCNKRISDASGDRGAWEIRFDKAKNYRTYNCTFWGISGVMMSAELSGVLEQVSEIDGYAGQYRGTLWLDFAGVDMASGFANQIRTTAPFSTGISSWKFAGIGSTTNNCSAVSLTRSVQGEISVMLTAGSGTQTSEVSGSLISGGDETEFVLEHQVSGTGKQEMTTRTHTLFFTSTSPDSVTVVWKKVYSTTAPYVGTRTETITDPAATTARDLGTVWKPLESKPVITVYK